MHKTIVFLPGDGIGPEVAQAALEVLQAVAPRYGLELMIRNALVGGVAIDAVGSPLPGETLRLAREADAVFLGAVGGPKWDVLPAGQRPENGLLALRKSLGVFANLRPVGVYQELAAFSCLRPDIVAAEIDLCMVRELTGGIYFGQPAGEGEKSLDGQKLRYAYNTMVYDEEEIRRIAHVAFKAAKGRRGFVTSVDKANVLHVSRLWRRVVEEVHAEYPDVTLEHMYVDNAAMQLVARPGHFDVVLTSNLFGDILSDLAAAVAGSLGLLASASVGAGGPGLFEPAHGSAPDIAGRGIANPLASILSAAMLLEYGLAAPEAAQAIRSAVRKAVRDGCRTLDMAPLAGKAALSCAGMTREVLARL